ncbi:MAG: SAM-dependent methyltransferase, partial [Nitratireductor sp.]|nr:SAM-dependent methyltransferase [Nitratireductor sp.]
MLAKAPKGGAAGTRVAAPVHVTLDNLPQVNRGLPFHVRLAVQLLTRLQVGALTLRLPDGRAFHFDAPHPGPCAELVLNNWRMPRRTLLGG